MATQLSTGRHAPRWLLAPRKRQSPQSPDRDDIATQTGRRRFPALKAEGFTLRELRSSDAASMLALLTSEEVARFISPPPTTLHGFERFIQWTDPRARGRPLSQLRRGAGRLRRRRGVVSDSGSWTRTFDTAGVGLRHRRGVLGQRSCPSKGAPDRRRVRVRGHWCTTGWRQERPWRTAVETAR